MSHVLRLAAIKRAGAETLPAFTTAARRRVLTPVGFLTRVATVPGGLALRANLELLQKAHDLAPLVDAIRTPLQRVYATPVERFGYIMSPLQQPMYHAGQDVRWDVVPLHDPSRRGDPGSLRHMSNLSGIRQL